MRVHALMMPHRLIVDLDTIELTGEKLAKVDRIVGIFDIKRRALQTRPSTPGSWVEFRASKAALMELTSSALASDPGAEAFLATLIVPDSSNATAKEYLVSATDVCIAHVSAMKAITEDMEASGA